MRGIADIQNLAWQKFNDAEVLLQEGRHDSAYYMAGYTLELLLKARICKTLKIDDFFYFEESEKKVLSKEAYRPFRVHDFLQLMILSGIYADFEIELKEAEFKEHWSTVSKWKEDARYLAGRAGTDVKNFLTSIMIISKWIEKHL